MKQSLITLKEIKKVFYTEEIETHALSNIALDIFQGEYVSISGPSGCGKSTLLSLIGLLDTATSGEFLLKQESVANITAQERARIRNKEIGFIFQSFNLISDLDVEENVELPLTYRTDLSKKQRKEMVKRRANQSGYEPSRQTLPFSIIRRTAATCGRRACHSGKTGHFTSR